MALTLLEKLVSSFILYITTLRINCLLSSSKVGAPVVSYFLYPPLTKRIIVAEDESQGGAVVAVSEEDENLEMICKSSNRRKT